MSCEARAKLEVQVDSLSSKLAGKEARLRSSVDALAQASCKLRASFSAEVGKAVVGASPLLSTASQCGQGKEKVAAGKVWVDAKPSSWTGHRVNSCCLLVRGRQHIYECSIAPTSAPC